MKRFSPQFGFGLAVALMLAVAAFAVVNLRTLMQESLRVRHSQTVAQKLEETISLVKDAQTAERGYVITGDDRYLEPYHKALAPVGGVSARLHELRQLTTDNSEQHRRLEALEPLVTSKLALVRRIIDLRRGAGFDTAQQLVASDEGQHAMDKIRARIAEMLTAESAMLQRRSDKASASARNTILVMATGGLLSLLLVFGAFTMVNREVRERRRAEEDARGLNRELDERVQQRTADVANAKLHIERQLEQLKSLRTIDLAILGTTDLRLVLKTVLAETKAQLNADIATVRLFDPHALMLEFAASIGLRTRTAETFRVRLGDGVTGNAALERRTIAVPNVDEATLARSEDARAVTAGEQVRAIYAIPLIAKGKLIGVLTIGFRAPFTADEVWLAFAEALAGQAAMAVESVQSFSALQSSNANLSLAYDTTIEGWARALDLRDKETEGHSRRVTDMTVQLATKAGMSNEELVHVRRGALLHDIGKMGVPDAILLKPAQLSDDEWLVMRQHPVYAYELLSPIAHLHPALDIPYCHHEKWDGSGYPRGLTGEAIPLAARLFAVVDVFDALSSDRPYRPKWPAEKVRDHIRNLAGTHFDPKAVELFLRVDNGSDPSATVPAEHYDESNFVPTEL